MMHCLRSIMKFRYNKSQLVIDNGLWTGLDLIGFWSKTEDIFQNDITFTEVYI